MSRIRRLGQSTKDALKLTIGLLAIMWLIQIINWLLGQRLSVFGIYPRDLDALTGILAWAFLHGSFAHLVMNTTPLALMGFFVAVRGVRTFIFSSLFIVVLAGLGVWVIGRSAYHVGASGLVFGYFGYLVALAWFEKKLTTFLVACLVLFYYGGMIYGVLPQDEFVSWEGHLCGLVAGVFAASIFTLRRRKATA